MSSKSFDKIESDFRQKGFWMRPLLKYEEKLIYDEEVENTKLRTLGFSYKRDLTKIFLKEIEECYQKGQLVSIASQTTAGAGKTKIMLSLARHCQITFQKVNKLGKAPKVITAIGRNQTLQAIKELTKNNIFFQDEDPFVSGTDSMSSGNSLQNLIEISFRFNKLTYLTAAVNFKTGRVKNFYTCYLEPLMWYEQQTLQKGTNNILEKKVTYCRLFSGKTLEPLGHVKIPILEENHEIQILHDNKEKRYKQDISDHGGYESVAMDETELKNKTELLLDKIFNNKVINLEELTFKEKIRIKKLRVETVKTKMNLLAYDMSGSEAQQRRIIDSAWNYIIELKTDLEILEELEKAELKEKKEREKQLLQQKLLEEKKINEEKLKKEQITLIESIIDEIINDLQLISLNVPLRIIKHQLRELGIHEKYLEFALAKIDKKIFFEREKLSKENNSRNEREKAKKRLQELENEKKLAIEQTKLIENIIPQVIEEFSLNEGFLKSTILKHYLKKLGIHENFLSHCIGEIELQAFYLQKENQNNEQIINKDYLIENEEDKFIFDENKFLEDLRKEKTKKRHKDWSFMIDIFLSKQNGLSYEQINSEFDISKGSIVNYTNMISGRISEQIGRDYELFRSKYMKNTCKYCQIVLAQQNDNKPDITVLCEKEQKKEYYSLKIRNLTKHKATETDNLIKKFKPEYLEAKKENGKMFIDYYNLQIHSHNIIEIEIKNITNKSKVRLKHSGEIEVLY